MTRDDFPALGDLIGGWFHQDYDLGGDDLPEIAANAAATLSPAQLAAVLDDIARFRAAVPAPRDTAFQRVFEPGADPAMWNLDATEWLAWLERELRRAAPPR